MFLEHENVRDNYHVNGDRLFRICSTNEAAKAWARNSASVPVDIGPRLKDSFPQIKEIVRWRKDIPDSPVALMYGIEGIDSVDPGAATQVRRMVSIAICAEFP